MDGMLGNKRASLQNGQECGYRPYYWRSDSLQSFNVISSSTLISILVRKTLLYRRNDENKCVDVSKDYENYFNATILEKVNTECRGPEIYLAEEEFCPTLHRLLIGRRNWGSTFQFRSRSTFMIEHFDANVWRAFCELWGPLTNTLHHGAGEVSISLYDLERVGGLPILGVIYQEFLPSNKDLTGHNKYPTTVAELLRVHAELCRFQNVDHIYYDLWLNYFYREYLV
ncbi:hypothetical protein Cgig2_033639 [Carnegiea gigantea]|uniref:Aminotransferase-like plant mobile domain-containing protein n=1 Tax=Carnegiea gigantea TaxID=171969 RepID=A0A9Q1K3K3_9CARY|nr:hypothetical protein Cgig2_033639 [Carnegiea gigantea]